MCGEGMRDLASIALRELNEPYQLIDLSRGHMLHFFSSPSSSSPFSSSPSVFYIFCTFSNEPFNFIVFSLKYF